MNSPPSPTGGVRPGRTTSGRRLPWRSLLYVPSNRTRYIQRAPKVGADGVIVDLEDSVPDSEKQAARAALGDVVPVVGASGASVLVRINRPLRLGIADLEAAVISGVDALVLPKADSAGYVTEIDRVVSELERERGLAAGSVRLVLLVENAQGVLHAAEIAAASRRSIAIGLGVRDFCTSSGIDVSSPAVAWAMHAVVLSARGAGLQVLGLLTSIGDYEDLAKLKDVAEASRALGSDGATCVHPSQVPVLNEVFGSSVDLEEARRVTASYEAAVAQGHGSVALDGRMIDRATYSWAQSVVQRAPSLGRRSEPNDGQREDEESQ
jgi:citrate lyase subunit beta / citryl-CoA lyase